MTNLQSEKGERLGLLNACLFYILIKNANQGLKPAWPKRQQCVRRYAEAGP